MPVVTSNAETRMKELLADSATLAAHQLIKCPAGKVLNVSSVKDAGANHVEVTFSPPINIRLGGVDRQWSKGFLYKPHWALPSMATAVPVGTTNPIPADRMLDWKQWLSAYDAWVKSGGVAIVAPTAPAAAVGEVAPTIEILQDTWLKTQPVDSSTLGATDKTMLKKGTLLPATVIGAKSGHGQVKLPDGADRFIFNAHFKGQETAAGQTASNAGRDFPVDEQKFRAACLKEANPNIPEKEVTQFCDAMLQLAAKYTITKREHLIHFLAQVYHESGCLMYLEELASGHDYTYGFADMGNQDADAIAAAAKHNMQTGPFYKGRSLIQLTHASNYREYGKAAGINAFEDPFQVAEYPHALGAALWFWSTRGPTLSEDANKGINDATCRAITKVVNGGQNGIDHRLDLMWAFDKLL